MNMKLKVAAVSEFTDYSGVGWPERRYIAVPADWPYGQVEVVALTDICGEIIHENGANDLIIPYWWPHGMTEEDVINAINE